VLRAVAMMRRLWMRRPLKSFKASKKIVPVVGIGRK
jgi:hypothetical protein